MGREVVLVSALVSRCGPMKKGELRLHPRTGRADEEMQPQCGALAEIELPVEPFGNEPACGLAVEVHHRPPAPIQLRSRHSRRRILARKSSTQQLDAEIFIAAQISLVSRPITSRMAKACA